MSYNDWPGTQTARRALRRIVDGKPAFAVAARTSQQMTARRQAIAYLFEEGFIERGTKGPVATEAGRNEFVRKANTNAYRDAEIALIVGRYAELGARVIARRIGRPVSGVSSKALELGVASRAACLRRQRGNYYCSHVASLNEGAT